MNYIIIAEIKSHFNDVTLIQTEERRKIQALLQAIKINHFITRICNTVLTKSYIIPFRILINYKHFIVFTTFYAVDTYRKLI